MQGDGIKSVTDSELGPILITGQCEHHNCPNQSVFILKLDGTVMGLCVSDLAGDPNKVVAERSVLGWSVKRTGEGLYCRADTPQAELAALKAAGARTT